MMLAYVDESNRGANLSFAGVVVNGMQAQKLTLELSALAQRLTATHAIAAPVVFHAYEMFHGRGLWSQVAPRARVHAFETVTAVVAQICTRIVYRSFNVQRGEIERSPLMKQTRQIFEARCLDLLLRGVNDCALGLDAHALVIADMRTDRESHRDRFEHSKNLAIFKHAEHDSFGRILDTIHFAPSRRSRLLQAADIVAFVLSRATIAETDARSARAMTRLVQGLQMSGKLDSRLA